MSLRASDIRAFAGVEVPKLRSVRIFAAALASWIYLLLLFRAYPGLDLEASRLFFAAHACGTAYPAGAVCGSFPLKQVWLLEAARTVLFYAPFLAALLLLLKIGQALQYRGSAYDGARVRTLYRAVLALVLGPGLLVNGYVKAFSHRPRPFETNLFGGEWAFRVAGDFSGQCLSNCSFVSGEAAGAGWLLCLLIFLPRHRHPRLVAAVVAASLVCALLRLAVGGHYLSDVVLGFVSAPVVFSGVFAVADCVALARQGAGVRPR